MNATGIDRRQLLSDPTVSAGAPAVVGSGLVTGATLTGPPAGLGWSVGTAGEGGGESVGLAAAAADGESVDLAALAFVFT